MPEQAISKLGYYYKDGQLYKVSAGVGVELVSTLPATGKDGTVYLTNANASSEGSIIEFPAPASEDEGKVFAVGSEGAVVLAQSVASVGGQSGAVSVKTVNGQGLVGSGNVAVQETLVSGTNIKTINNATVLGSGDISLATKAEHLKSLYHLGAYDSVDTSNADYDLITRGTGYYKFTGNETWTKNNAGSHIAYICHIIEGIVKNPASSSVLGNIKSPTLTTQTALDIFNVVVSSGIGINAEGIIFISASDYANRATLVNGTTIEYELADSYKYTEKVLKNQPLSQLDQNGENWLRGEYEKTLNLWGNLNSLGGFPMDLLEDGVTYNISVSNGANHIFKCSAEPYSSTSIFDQGDISNYTFTKTSAMNGNFLYVLSQPNVEVVTSGVMLNSGSTAKPFVDYNGPIMHAVDVEGVKLWENGNPYAQFTARGSSNTITLADSLANYKYIVAVMGFNYYEVVGDQVFKFVARVNTDNVIGWAKQSTGESVWCSLQIVSNTQVYFSDTKGPSGNTANSYLTPRAIYGVNGL